MSSSNHQQFIVNLSKTTTEHWKWQGFPKFSPEPSTSTSITTISKTMLKGEKLKLVVASGHQLADILTKPLVDVSLYHHKLLTGG